MRKHVILLAAGKSTRMGQPKGLVDFRGAPWMNWQLHRLESISDSITVVLGGDLETYFEKLPILRELAVRNPDPDRGPFSSLLCGLEKVFEESGMTDRFFVLPVDVPCPEAKVWDLLQNA